MTMTEQQERLRDRFRGCIVGLAVGDALGMPVETMTPEEIRRATDGKGVTGFLAPLQKRFHSTACLKAGQWTDDTQLALALARSLVRQRELNLADVAAEHVVEYRKGRRGWGGSTTRAIKEVAYGRRTWDQAILDPKAHGMGNGVAMKVAPLALVFVGAPDPPSIAGLTREKMLRARLTMSQRLCEDVDDLAKLTHRDRCASMGAFLIATAVHNACTWEPVAIDGTAVHARFAHIVAALEAPAIGRLEAPAARSCDAHGEQLFAAAEFAIGYGFDVARLARIIGTSASVLESVPFVLGVVRQHLGNFREGVLAAVNAGGDTDSNGAMVGAILGAYHGLSGIPQGWVAGVEARDEIIQLADQIFELSGRTGDHPPETAAVGGT